MRNKGFTLVEVVAVMVVMAIIMIIVIPSVRSALSGSRENAYLKQIDNIEMAAKKWGLENDSKLPDIGSDEIVTVDFQTLYNLGYLKEHKIINPKTEEELTGCVKVSYNIEYNQYEYKYSHNLAECNNYNINNE